jgi:hypothetical protein
MAGPIQRLVIGVVGEPEPGQGACRPALESPDQPLGLPQARFAQVLKVVGRGILSEGA